jgi:hypothetical protein
MVGAEPETDAGATRPTFAVALRTSVGSGVNGVRTDAFAGTHTPYCGLTLTEDFRSSVVKAFWVAVDPARWTTFATAACALL